MNLIKSANKATKNLTKKLKRLGVDEKNAIKMAGELYEENLNIIKNKAGATQKFKGVVRRATVARVVKGRDVMFDNMIEVLRDRYGIPPDILEQIEEDLRSMTLGQYVKWYKENEDLVDDIFSISPPTGLILISQDEVDHLVNRINQSFNIIRD